MSNPFNFKAVHLFLLSLFVFLLVLSVTGSIDSSIISDIVIRYSIFGIVVCLVSWIVDSMILNEADKVPQYWHNKIHKILDKRNKNNWFLIGILLFTLIFQFLLPSAWWMIYLIFGFLYFPALKIFVLDDE